MLRALVMLVLVVASTPVFARGSHSSSSSHSSHTSTHRSSSSHSSPHATSTRAPHSFSAAPSTGVRGYSKRDGTYVPQHHRTTPDRARSNNWTTKGNVNPYTGKAGTKKPDGH